MYIYYIYIIDHPFISFDHFPISIPIYMVCPSHELTPEGRIRYNNQMCIPHSKWFI